MVNSFYKAFLALMMEYSSYIMQNNTSIFINNLIFTRH